MNPNALYSDRELVPLIKDGIKEAFETIYHRYKHKLFYFSYGYLHSQSEAEEIIQQVFISFWEHRHTLNQELSIKNYLYKSTINALYNYFKHKSVQQKYIQYSQQNDPKQEEGLNTAIYSDELHDMVDTLVAQLPYRQQQVFKMSRWDGLSYEEIAASLGISVRTVENQVYRVLKFLKENLKEEYMFFAITIGMLSSFMG